MIQIELKNYKDVATRINKLRISLGKTDVPMKAIGLRIHKWILDNFAAEGALGGKKWAPLATSTVMARRGGKLKKAYKGGKITKGEYVSSAGIKILQDTGLMRASYNWRARADEVRIGSPEKKAKWHQEGGKHMPARPMLPPESIATQIAMDEIERWAKGVVAGAH